MTQTDRLISEMERVFAAKASLLAEDAGTATVAMDGWPEPVKYHMDKAISVLVTVPTGAGADAEGDARVCRLLEDWGAFID